MRSYMVFAVLMVLTMAAGATAQTVTLTLDSPQNDQAVQPGASIDWHILFLSVPYDIGCLWSQPQ